MRAGPADPSYDQQLAGVPRETVAATLFQLAVIAAIVIRIALPPPLLNLFINYSTEAGAIYEKIHPGTYLILGLLALSVAMRPLRLFRWELPAVRALVIFTVGSLATALLLVPMGRAGSAGYFIDSYVVTGAAGLLLYTESKDGRLRVASVVLLVLGLSALMGLAEMVTRMRIMPYNFDELGFRPTGLGGHPLMLGLMSCAAIGFAWVMPWSARRRAVLIGILLLGTIAAEARFATLMAGATVMGIVLLSKWPGFSSRQERRGKVLLFVLIIALVIPAFALLQALGFLGRLNEGLVDESSMARVDVYRVFTLVSFRDILMGADIAGITKLVNDEIGIEFIESTPIILVFQLGLPGALAFTAMTVFLFWRLCRGVTFPAILSTVAFFATALSNNTLSTKTAAVMTVVVLLVAIQDQTLATRPRRRIRIKL